MVFIIFDLEATCWDNKPAHMVQETIEIGAVAIDGFGEEVGRFQSLVKPIIHPNLSGYCYDLTSIDQSEINRSADFNEVFNEFIDWIEEFDEDFLLASWGDFDRHQLVLDCKLHDLEFDWISEKHIDLKTQYHKFKRLRRNHGLKHVLEVEGYEFEGEQHRALTDAENLSILFNDYIDEWIY